MISQLMLFAQEAGSVSKTLWDFVQGMAPNDRAPVLGITVAMTFGLIILLAAIMSKTMCRMHKARLEDSLKRELVDRGFSANEIAKVIETSALAEQRGPRFIWGRMAC